MIRVWFTAALLVIGLVRGIDTVDNGLLISTLTYEEIHYVRNLVRNLVSLTLPSTNIIVHFSASSKVNPPEGSKTSADWWANGSDRYIDGGASGELTSTHAFTSRDRERVFINPNRGPTHHAIGSVLRQHLSNFEHARADLKLKPAYIMFHAAHSRLLTPGVEHFIAKNKFAFIEQAAWLPIWCLRHRRRLPVWRTRQLTGWQESDRRGDHHPARQPRALHRWRRQLSQLHRA